MRLIDKLHTYPKEKITTIDIQRLGEEPDYIAFHQIVENLVRDNILSPVKNSGKNGRIPSLYNKYHIIKEKKDFNDELNAIRQLHPSLNISDYLSNPKIFKKHQVIVEGLSCMLWHSPELLQAPMSRKERSFSIWGQEKLLDTKLDLLKKVLEFNHLEENFLNYYDTPEPFFEYGNHRSNGSTVLIIENKDTWFTLRKLMQESGKSVLADNRIDILLYGEGGKITKPGALEEYSTLMLNNTDIFPANFLYFGDLDPEGIRLFFRVRDNNPKIKIKPFAALYVRMIELARQTKLPLSGDQRNLPYPLDEFLTLIGPDCTDELQNILETGYRIPQEILNYQIMIEILK